MHYENTVQRVGKQVGIREIERIGIHLARVVVVVVVVVMLCFVPADFSYLDFTSSSQDSSLGA